jgi:DNA-binding transcriptional MerR regulator
MPYTVKQLADLAGISRRTLHYYDQIGLLEPSSVGENRYRFYGEDAVLRLQQVLFYRELDLGLDEIRAILDRPDFDVVRALEAHKQALHHRIERLEGLIRTVDKTLQHTKGKVEMSAQELFEGFDEETQQRYELEAAQRWGEDIVKGSRRRWDGYSAQQKAAIFAEAGQIYRDLAARIGEDPAGKDVQSIVARWHQNLRWFYEPSREILLGLGHAYTEDPRFAAFFTRIHKDLPAFLHQAIEHYCQSMPAGAKNDG